MCEMFIKHVLEVGENHPGLYGNTNAYYGTVEQQGRLTLHMQMLIWLKGVLSPQEIRDRIMDPTSDFQQKIVEYLESVHIGEFMTGTQEEVKHHIEIKKTQNPNYQDPTLFVKLHKSAKVIQIPGLPENVVPLVKGTKTITCVFPSDLEESVERQHVNFLPNFAMTDYAS